MISHGLGPLDPVRLSRERGAVSGGWGVRAEPLRLGIPTSSVTFATSVKYQLAVSWAAAPSGSPQPRKSSQTTPTAVSGAYAGRHTEIGNLSPRTV